MAWSCEWTSRKRVVSELMTYKGVLLQDIANMAWLFGYINAPWTLKVDMADQLLLPRCSITWTAIRLMS